MSIFLRKPKKAPKPHVHEVRGPVPAPIPPDTPMVAPVLARCADLGCFGSPCTYCGEETS